MIMFILKNGKSIKAKQFLGLIPAEYKYKDMDGKIKTVLERDVQQIDPPLTETPKDL